MFTIGVSGGLGHRITVANFELVPVVIGHDGGKHAISTRLSGWLHDRAATSPERGGVVVSDGHARGGGKDDMGGLAIVCLGDGVARLGLRQEEIDSGCVLGTEADGVGARPRRQPMLDLADVSIAKRLQGGKVERCGCRQVCDWEGQRRLVVSGCHKRRGIVRWWDKSVDVMDLRRGRAEEILILPLEIYLSERARFLLFLSLRSPSVSSRGRARQRPGRRHPRASKHSWGGRENTHSRPCGCD